MRSRSQCVEIGAEIITILEKIRDFVSDFAGELSKQYAYESLFILKKN